MFFFVSRRSVIFPGDTKLSQDGEGKGERMEEQEEGKTGWGSQERGKGSSMY